jgi:hypothetical protein
MESSYLTPQALIFRRFAALSGGWRKGGSKVLFERVGYMWIAALRFSDRCRLIF